MHDKRLRRARHATTHRAPPPSRARQDVVTRATAAIGDLPIRGAVFRPRALAQLIAAPAFSAPHAPPTNREIPDPRQAGTLPTVTGSIGSRCHAACATNDRVVADGIRAEPRGCRRAGRRGARLSLMGYPLYLSDPACLEHETPGGIPSGRRGSLRSSGRSPSADGSATNSARRHRPPARCSSRCTPPSTWTRCAR